VLSFLFLFYRNVINLAFFFYEWHAEAGETSRAGGVDVFFFFFSFSVEQHLSASVTLLRSSDRA